MGFNGYPETLEEVSKRYNVTRERVRQIEEKAIEKALESERIKKYHSYYKAFNGVSRTTVHRAIATLSEEEKEFLKYRCGGNIDSPQLRDLNGEESLYYLGCLKPKINSIIHKKEFKVYVK